MTPNRTHRGSRRRARALPTAVALLLATLVVPAATAQDWRELGQMCKAESLFIPEGQTRTGDTYIFAVTIDVSGVQDGDLIAFTQSLQINGEVTGDVAAFATSVVINGTVRDSVRVFAQSVTVNGRIEGDLVAFGAFVNLTRSAEITGSVWLGGGQLVANGTVDGDLRGGGGEMTLDGTIGGDASLELDTLKFGPGASIAGDLSYTTRKELVDLEGRGIVGGTIDFREKKKKKGEPKPWITTGGVLWWLWHVVSTLIVGVIVLLLFRRSMVRMTDALGAETLLGGLIGFGTFIGALGASLLAIVLVLTLPLGVAVLLLFLVAVYLAKIPVAVWLGRLLVRDGARADRPPLLAFFLGTVILYLIFEIPFWIGTISWFVVNCLGLGAAVLGLRHYLRERQEVAPGGGAAVPAADVSSPAP